MKLFTNKVKIILYVLGAAAVVATVPLGNAVKDWGLIHTIGIVIALFVAAGIFWEIFGKK